MRGVFTHIEWPVVRGNRIGRDFLLRLLKQESLTAEGELHGPTWLLVNSVGARLLACLRNGLVPSFRQCCASRRR